MEKIKFDELIGKTILNINRCKLKNYDDYGYILIEFTDNTKIIIESGYGGYTGKSIDEYPTDIKLYSATDKKLSELDILN